VTILSKAAARRAMPLGLAAAVLGGSAMAVLPAQAHDDDKGPHNVILIVGDGMGTAQREAARLDQVGLDGLTAMDSLPVSGMQETDPRDPEATVTDSAAAASAWATGVKTFNGAISVDTEGRSLPTLGLEARKAGKATGLVTTSQVTDASPAAFFSNTSDRGEQSDIARQYLERTKPDVILGGGEDWWFPAGRPGHFQDNPPDDPTEASKGTEGNLVQLARRRGYQYVNSAAQLERARGHKLLGLFANEEMFQQFPEGEGDEYDPRVPLTDMTRKALQVLEKDRDGFFLLVEEEAIDEMSHNNNGPRTLEAMRALEETVELAQAYVDEHPETLLIVTGDHECGGLTIEDEDADDESGDDVSAEDGPFDVADSDKTFVMDWTTTAHTGGPTPVTATGFRADRLDGYYPNTFLHEVMRSVLVERG
jgi:alkaline phosphatase